MGYKTLLIATVLSIISHNANAARLKRHNNDDIERAIQEMADDHRYHAFRPSFNYCPITTVVQREFSADAHHSQAVNLTVGMVAIIHYTHIERARRQERPTIPRAVYDFLELADRATNDEAGHLLAHSIGGPTDAGSTYNFLPQSRCLNRDYTRGYNYVSVQPNWYGVERTIRDYLNDPDHRPHSAHWHLQVMFGEPNSRRPTSFRVIVRFYDGYNVHIPNFDEGPYEIINPPHDACSDQAHPWWSNLDRSTTTARSVPEYIVPELTPAGQFINVLTLGAWPGTGKK